MKKLNAKKKGSALITVVALCAILGIITLSVMTMTVGGFKLRKQQNKRVEGFYGADSGIEIAQNKIVEVIDLAIENGDARVAAIKADPTIDNTVDVTVEGWENKPFQEYFRVYIDANLENEIDNTEVSGVTDPATLTKLYDDFMRNENVDPATTTVTGEKIKVDAKVEARETVAEVEIQPWTIESNFTDKDNKNRIVKVSYAIETPVYGKTSGESVTNSSIFNYLMGIDGNLNITSGGSFQSIGSMWVGGDNQSGNREFDEINYKPAVNFKRDTQAKGEFYWKGDIVTPGDIMVDDVKLRADNIYADDFLYRYNGDTMRNLKDVELIDKVPYGAMVHNLEVKENLSVYNDFIYDTNKSTATIKNFYGLDDIDETEVLSTEDYGKSNDNIGRSSSIIVNSPDFGVTSKINVLNDFYALGTAYLKLDGIDYKTGESVAINKYSEPYTARRAKEKGIEEGDFLYKYHNPLHLLDKQYKEGEYKDLSVQMKADEVKRFIEEDESKADAKMFAGLQVNAKNTYSAGVVYANGAGTDKSIVDSMNRTMPVCLEATHKHNTISNKDDCLKKQFVEQAYNMGTSLESDSEALIMFEEKNKDASVRGSFNWKFIKDNLMNKFELTGKILGKDTADIADERLFVRTASYPADAEEKTVAVFDSIKTSKEILPEVDLGTIGGLKMRIIFNISDKGVGNVNVGEPKKVVFTDSTKTTISASGDKIEMPLGYIEKNASDPVITLDDSYTDTEETEIKAKLAGDYATVLISDGEINIIQPRGVRAWEVRGLFYTPEDLNFDVTTGMTFGNISVPEFDQLNNIFKKLFGGVIGGVVDDGVIDQGSGEVVLNPSDLLKENSWELIK